MGPIMYDASDTVIGTGKTLVGAEIAYWLAKLNRESKDVDAQNKKIRKQVLYCGPSNSSVDVAANTYVSRCFNVAYDFQTRLLVGLYWFMNINQTFLHQHGNDISHITALLSTFVKHGL